MEKLEVKALGGPTSSCSTTSATGLGLIDVDLAGTLGGSAGDGQADTVIVNADDSSG